MKTTGRLRRFVTVTSVFRSSTRFRTWLVPLLIVVLLLAGWWIRTSLTKSIEAQTAEEIQTILDAQVAALQVWLQAQERFATLLGQSRRVGTLVDELDRLQLEEGNEVLVGARAQRDLRDLVEPMIEKPGYLGYIVVDQQGLVFAASRDESLGTILSPEGLRFLAPVMVGQPVVSLPFLPKIPIPDRERGVRDGLPTMVVAGPVLNESGRVIAAIALTIRPEDDFTRILQTGRLAESGETYAFDAQGLLLSQSRFEDELRTIGLLPEGSGDSSSELTIQVRDPGGDLTRGFVPTLELDDRPLTRMALAAAAGTSGVDVEGYRDYRGVMVVGAWTWLPEYQFGVAIEMDHDEALRMPGEMRRILWIMVGLLVLGAGIVLGGSAFISRLGRKMDAAVMEARQLGQYTIEKKIGAGGMGEVYRARHAMLRRPTAIKLLHPDRAGKEQIARFEREVQMTSRLTHPNTIAVYDYGKTPDGVFYYAMEYLPGINLAGLVEIDGPQTEGRVIHILRQACGSLEEAHDRGLIHRDIKPENIILCERGSAFDVAKVLDFGIVKQIEEESAKLTVDGTLSGTPHYVSPEALRGAERVDARADLYALGAVGYFLLTGLTVFEGETTVDILTRHLREIPVPPSTRAGRAIAPDLEAVIMACLERDSLLRPRDAATMARDLERCADAASWTREDARRWWSHHPELRGDPEDADEAAGGEAAPTVVDTPGEGGHTATAVMDPSGD